MRHSLIAAFTAASVFVFAGCTPLWGGAGLNPSAPASTPSAAPSSRHASALSPFVYVGNGSTKTLDVFPNAPNAKAIRLVTLDGAPIGGVATDSNGRIYVSEQAANEVQVFADQGRRKVGTISAVLPDGVAVDGSDNVYVATHAIASQGPYTWINVYAPGVYANVTRRIQSPKDYAFEGVAVDRSGDVFATVYQNQGGFLIEYPHGGSSFVLVSDICIAQGVGVDYAGNVQVANCATLTQFNAPGFSQGRSIYYGHEAIRFIGSASDGSIYVPLNGGSNPRVVVYPARALTASYSIPIADPIGAAAGL